MIQQPKQPKQHPSIEQIEVMLGKYTSGIIPGDELWSMLDWDALNAVVAAMKATIEARKANPQ
jgi:hypothetical protein